MKDKQAHLHSSSSSTASESSLSCCHLPSFHLRRHFFSKKEKVAVFHQKCLHLFQIPILFPSPLIYMDRIFFSACFALKGLWNVAGAVDPPLGVGLLVNLIAAKKEVSLFLFSCFVLFYICWEGWIMGHEASFRSKAAHFVSDLTTVILNPIADELPSSHVSCFFLFFKKTYWFKTCSLVVCWLCFGDYGLIGIAIICYFFTAFLLKLLLTCPGDAGVDDEVTRITDFVTTWQSYFLKSN